MRSGSFRGCEGDGRVQLGQVIGHEFILLGRTQTDPEDVWSLLSHHLDRLVIDRTGLTGRFDLELEAFDIKAPPDYKPGPSDLELPPAKGPSIFEAVREQLGLSLRPETASVPVIVIDHAERPSP